MSVTDDRVSKLLAEVQDQPSPEEAFSKWLFIDVFILDGLMILFLVLFIIVQNLYIVSLVGAFSIAFGTVYLYAKDNAKRKMTGGRDFLDSQTIIGDYEIREQIPILSYTNVLLPKETIKGDSIRYSRIDIGDALGTLKTSSVRIGGRSSMSPEVVENLVRLRLKELKELEETKRRFRKKSDKASKKDKELSEADDKFLKKHGGIRHKKIEAIHSEEVTRPGDFLDETSEHILEKEEKDVVKMSKISFDDLDREEEL